MIFLGSKWADSSTSRTICMPSNRYSSTSLTLRWENIFNQYPNKRKSAQLLKSTIERLSCWGTRTRTRKGRTRICSVTITPYPKLRLTKSVQIECRELALCRDAAWLRRSKSQICDCKGSGFFRNNKEKTHFFIKNPKIFCFYCTFRIIPCIFVGQNNIFNI